MAAAEGAEAQAAKIRKERQDYEDAQRAYNDTLNRVSQGVANPMAMQSQYSSTGGPERAATDPWVRQNHPDLSSAAQKLVKEEGEYRAIDEPASHHAQNNCSIPAYIGKKFYEYVAQAEMIYKLATDTEFRNKVIEQLGTAAKSAFSPGGWFSDFVVSANGPPMGSLSGGAESQAAFDKAWNEYQAATDRTVSRLQAVFSKMWDDFSKEWKECGLASAVTKVGIDGLFLGGEIVVGGAALRGIRFAYRLTKEGRHAVDIISVDTGKTIGSHSWPTEALDSKYGKPSDNQVAGVLKDTNRKIGDGPANEPSPTATDPKKTPETATRAIRTKEELLAATGGRVPTYASGKFNSWWNDLSVDELKMLLADEGIAKQIKAQVRAPGGLHEWLMTSLGPDVKKLGFTMEDIKAMTTPTKKAEGRVPNSNYRWRHTNEDGTTGENSGKMHKALEEAIKGAKDRDDLLRRLEDFSNKWLDNGPDSFPPPLRDLIKQNN